MDQQKWDRRFLDLANNVAQWSKDPSRKTGCVIARGKHVLSLGYNGFPAQVEDTPERYSNRELKLQFMVHAERNAIHNAREELAGSTLYTRLSPCAECAKSIVLAGISRVVYEEALVKTGSPPGEMYNVSTTDLLFTEAGIIMEQFQENKECQ